MIETPPAAEGSATKLLRDMIRVRTLEEQCAQLYGQEKIRGFLHLYIGEEAVAAGILDQLDDDDAVLATYREHGHALLRGVSARSIMAEMFGKSTGCSGGRGGSMHLFDQATRFFGGNAIVAGHLPLAVGLALADQMRGRPTATACFFGEGAMAEGEFHEAMNLAALWKTPTLFCCENNLYAMGTSLETSESQTNLAVKAAGYDVPAWTVDGMDVVAVRDAASRALALIRGGGGPVFLELRTFRYRAHSMFDPELYRDKAEVDSWRSRDPIDTLSRQLLASGQLEESGLHAIRTDAAEEIADAVQFAESSPLEPAATLGQHVYRREVALS